MDQRLHRRLRIVARRLQAIYIAVGWCGVLGLSSLVGWLLLQGRRQGWVAHSAVWWWLGTTAVLILLAAWLVGRRYANARRVVHRLERQFPDLNQTLLTATELQARPDGSLGYLQRHVIAEAIRHDVIHRWKSMVSGWKVLLSWLLNVPAVLLVAWILVDWHRLPAEPSTSANIPMRGNRLSPPTIDPGDTQVERGSNVIVTAHFSDRLPSEVWLRYTSLSADGQPIRDRIRMRQSLDDPVFAAYLEEVEAPVTYDVEYDRQETRRFRIDVFEYPALVRADAVLEFPSYTHQEPKTVVDTRRITVAEGTKVTWQLHLNKPVAQAELVPIGTNGDHGTEGDHGMPPLRQDAADPQKWSTTFTAATDVQWKLRLVDAQGRENPAETILSMRVLPNRSAAVRLTSGGDAVVSPLQEFSITAQATDDFAITAAGIGYQLAGESALEIDVPVEGAPVRELALHHVLPLEQLAAQPGQLISYYVWVEDLDSTGQPRRDVSDIFFLEVRPFDEIYRQGQQPSADQQSSSQNQQGQQGNEQTEELLELQKQIVAATWNVLRQARTTLSAPMHRDVQQILTSQTEAMTLLEEKAAEATPEIEALIKRARHSMQAAVTSLEDAIANSEKASLTAALGHEQAAYQALLQMQSREHEVVRSQQRNAQSRSQRAQARQQQIDQLQLDNQENRYENQRLAQDQQEREQAELRQILSRLRELAARQEDLNERLRELEAALQMAQNEDERQQLAEQLERLRQQQQEMLRDSDELQERMETSSSESIQQAREAMEQTRQNLQRSSQALAQGDTSDALAAGTRAEEQLERLQDEVRQQAATQFADRMESLRQQAAELEQRQRDIVEKLEASNTQNPTGLRGPDQYREATEMLEQQQSTLNHLLQQIQETVLQAEEAEPLLAERLYETYQQAEQQRAGERLEVSRQLLERNLQEQGRELARESIVDLERLRQGVEQAAEAVLGSEVESLRMALNQLEQASEQLDRALDEASEEAGGERSNDGRTRPPEDAAEPAAESPPASPGPATQPSDQRTSSATSSSGNENNAQQRLGPQAEDQRPASQTASSDQRQSAAQRPAEQTGASESPNAQEEQPSSRNQPSAAEGGNVGRQSGEGPTSGPENRRGRPSESQPQPGIRPSSPQPTRPTDGRTTGGGTWTTGGGNPITGDSFQEWSDRLRDVEELVVDPELRWEATQVRQTARELRRQYRKHARAPQWSEVEELVARPLRDLKRKVADELIRRAAERTEIVPIDRDPVPPEFSRSVQEYYENLGSGRQ
ncbi:MAG: hypothetical protein KatS3mg111_3020 [Pirellulaceae bacterium]|nr:MAG: hypothetical protein KatS3mg111_3020 [Pirellulaceae bacterium]